MPSHPPPSDSRIPCRGLIFSPQPQWGNVASTGRGRLVSGEPLPHLSDVHRAPLNRSAKASNFTPERLLSRGDCVTGPFLRVSGNSSFCWGHGWWRRTVAAQSLLKFSHCCFLFGTPQPPFLKIIKAPTTVGNQPSLRGQSKRSSNKSKACGISETAKDGRGPHLQEDRHS